jgi:membrane-associated phospholipid phosphatase
MAVLGGREHHRLGLAMATVAWLLGAARMAAGLHYPSDVIGGAVLGEMVGYALRV